MTVVLVAFFAFLETFQKSPGGLFIAARRYMYFNMFLGSWRGTAWRHIPDRYATPGILPNSGCFWMKGLAVLVESPSDTSQIGSLLVFLGFGLIQIW